MPPEGTCQRRLKTSPMTRGIEGGWIQEKSMIKTVGVLGARQMGNGIVHVFAQYGFPVVLTDMPDDIVYIR
jgi:3-hydroxyacyl-CoA dehydrogenase-like protein